MTGKMPRKVRGNWEYPELGEVLAATGLHIIITTLMCVGKP